MIETPIFLRSGEQRCVILDNWGGCMGSEQARFISHVSRLVFVVIFAPCSYDGVDTAYLSSNFSRRGFTWREIEHYGRAAIVATNVFAGRLDRGGCAG